MSRLRPQDAEQRAQRATGADFSEALARGLNVINAFDEHHRQMTLSDLAKAIDLPRATVRRALATLVALGYVETEGRLFRLTPRILKLAGAYLSSNPVSTILQPLCERLSQQVDASCSVAVLDGDEAVMIARAVPMRPSSVGLGVGYRVPVFCSALGRALMSAMPDEQLDKFIARLKPTRFTRQTVIAKPEIRRLILDVRKKGYALADQEAEIGIRSIAVPLESPWRRSTSPARWNRSPSRRWSPTTRLCFWNRRPRSGNSSSDCREAQASCIPRRALL
jgi:IclR family transcriptional regulator, pca regulon regulatory protein